MLKIFNLRIHSNLSSCHDFTSVCDVTENRGTKSADPAAANHDVPIVEDGCLPRRDGALRLIEGDQHFVRRRSSQWSPAAGS